MSNPVEPVLDFGLVASYKQTRDTCHSMGAEENDRMSEDTENLTQATGNQNNLQDKIGNFVSE